MSLPAGRSAPAILAPGSVIEEPEFFASADRPLYSMTYRPGRPRPAAPVVVHCHGFGVEQLTSYRSEVITARATAGIGIPTFRYHSRGHGDSGGDFADVTLEGMVEDALAAADRAKSLTGASRVVYLGVRFGALVAAQAAAKRGDMAGLALWEPVKKGEDYFRGTLRNLLLSQVASGRRPDVTVDALMHQVERDGSVDVHGYYLHANILRSAREASLEHLLEGYRGPALLVQIQARSGLTRVHGALVERLTASGIDLRAEVVADEPGWNFVSNPAWRSAELTRLTREWLDALA